MLAEASNALLRVLLAPACAACAKLLERPLASPVCPACWRALRAIPPPWCARCGDALHAWRAADPLCVRCRRRQPAFVLARSVGIYDGSLRDIVHAFKYERRRVLAAPLGALMRAAGADVLAGADAVVPVPLHPLRVLERGFNQADDLARELRLPVWRVLRRTRHGPPQAGLPAARRHGNVRLAFAVRRWPPARHTLRNASVLLVDDVMTTGATAGACAKVLLDAGVRNVRVLTVARAVTERPVPQLQPPPPWAAPRR